VILTVFSDFLTALKIIVFPL